MEPRGDFRDRDQLLADADRLGRHLGCEPVGTHADRADHAACDGRCAAQVSEHTARVLAIEDVLARQRTQEVTEVGGKLRSKFQPLLFGRQRLVIAADLTVSCRASPNREAHVCVVCLEEMRSDRMTQLVPRHCDPVSLRVLHRNRQARFDVAHRLPYV